MRVDRRKIDLPNPIKRIGRYEIPIELFQDVRIEVKTLVVPEGGELPPEDEAEPVAEGEATEGAPRGSRSCPRGRSRRARRGSSRRARVAPSTGPSTFLGTAAGTSRCERTSVLTGATGDTLFPSDGSANICSLMAANGAAPAVETDGYEQGRQALMRPV